MLGTLIGQKQALVLAGKGAAEAVFEQARAAHDQRAVFKVIQRHRKPLHDFGRETGVLENLHDLRILPPDLVNLLVLVLDQFLEVVVRDKAHDPVGADVPRFRRFHIAQQLVLDGHMLNNSRRHKHAGALAAQLAVTSRRKNQPVEQIVEIRNVNIFLGDIDEFELVGEEAADQRDADLFLAGRRQFDALRGQGLEATNGVGNFAQRRAQTFQSRDQEA